VVRGLLLIFLTTFSSFAIEEVKVITYYNYSPWLELNTTITSLLNEQLSSKYKFTALYLPRKRLDQLLLSKDKVIVTFTNPKFFGDLDKQKYSWTAPLLVDHSFYISKKTKPFLYENESSYTGKNFSGILGHHYTDLEKAVSEKRLEIEYAASEISAVLKVFNSKRNLDFSVIDTSTLKGMESLGTILRGQYVLSKRPGYGELERLLLVSKSDTDLFSDVELALMRISKLDKWLKIIGIYQKQDINSSPSQ